MDTRYSQGDLDFMAEVRVWFEANTPPEMKGRNFMFGSLTVEENIAWGRILNAKGWAAVNWPQEHGGTGWTQTRKHIFEQVRAETRAPLLYSMGVNMLGPVLCAFGTPAQKQRYLPRILAFDDWWCQGYSEPGAGSDLASLSTTATRRGDEYVVNGSKIWTTYAHVADRIFCLVRTGRGAKKQEGISFLLIDMKQPGVEIRPIISIDGKHHLNQVFFDDARAPREDLVGEEGQGWSIAKYLLTHERTGIARIPLSRMELARLKELSRLPAGAGRLIDQEGLRLKIAQVEMELDALEFTNLRMLTALDAGEAPGAESSLLKIRGTRIQQTLAELRLELAGYLAYPWGTELPVGEADLIDAARNYSFSRASTIYGGSTEIQYNVMAKAVLGL